MTNTYATPIKEPTAVADQSQASNASREGKSKYRPEIDGLRAFAVVAVIVNHFNKDLLPSGYLGVDIFFVISGYVITSSLSGRESKNFWDFILSFYERRIKRLVPALAVFIAVSSLLLCFFNPDPSYPLEIATYALFGLSNISLRNTATDYFAPSTALNPFTHTWSLGVEEQFYLLFPIIIWFSGFGRKSKNGGKYLYWTVGALSISSLVGFAYLYPINQPDAYFLMPPRFWELGSGCLVFLGLQKQGLVLQQLEKIPPLLIIVLMVGVLFLPLALALPATIAIILFSGLLICSLKEGTNIYKFFTLDKVVHIGLISYSLYLWHWGVLSISRWTIGIHWWTAPLQIFAMILIANISYKFIEKPFRNTRLKTSRLIAISIGFVLSIAMAIILSLLKDSLSSRLFLGKTSDLENQYKGSNASKAEWRNCNIYGQPTDSELISPACGHTLNDKNPTIYLLGDSHINQFGKTITAFALRHGFNYREVWGNACPFPSIEVSKGSQICSQRQDIIEKRILQLVKQGDIIFIGNNLHNRFNPPNHHLDSRGDLRVDLTAVNAYGKKTRNVSDLLANKGAKVVLYLYAPQFDGLEEGVGNTCEVQWYRPILQTNCSTKEDDFLKERDLLLRWIPKWANNQNKLYWDGIDPLTCEGRICNARHYKDQGHFKEYYTDYVFQKFLKGHPLAS